MSPNRSGGRPTADHYYEFEVVLINVTCDCGKKLTIQQDQAGKHVSRPTRNGDPKMSKPEVPGAASPVRPSSSTDADSERRGLRRDLYVIVVAGALAWILAFPYGLAAGSVVSTIALAGLAASC